MKASITLKHRHALDIAALSYAAGRAGSPSSLKEMIINIPDSKQVNYVTFGATNSYIAATRRGTYGEFDGEVKGEGVFSMDAQKLAKILRLSVKQFKDRDIRLDFLDSDGLEVNGENVGVAYHSMAEYSARRIDQITGPLFEKGTFENDYYGTLPAFNMELLQRLAAASNVSTERSGMRVMKLVHIDRNRWGFVTPTNDSWSFAGVVQEYKL